MRAWLATRAGVDTLMVIADPDSLTADSDCFRAAVTAAKLKNVTIYTLKHTAASRMIRAGVDLVTVTELIRHADVKTTMIYCHSDAETKRKAVEKMSRICSRIPKNIETPLAPMLVTPLSSLPERLDN